MSLSITDPVLILGGSGIVGAKTAQILRKLYPDLPIAIGGRDLAKARNVANEIGNAQGVKIDLERDDLGQSADASYSAFAVFVKDVTLNSMKYAQTHGLPYLSVSSGVFEVAPEMALAISKPNAAPILMASNWLAGAATFPALQAARKFKTIDDISITVVLDEEDMGGPAAFADYERLTESAPNTLLLTNGRWNWVKGDDKNRTFTDIDGTKVESTAYSPLDVLSLSTATNAKSIRVGLVYGTSASRRRGEPFSTEIAIEITGELFTGERVASRLDIVHPEGQAPLTALHVALSVERLLGLHGGEPVKAGLYLRSSFRWCGGACLNSDSWSRNLSIHRLHTMTTANFYANANICDIQSSTRLKLVHCMNTRKDTKNDRLPSKLSRIFTKNIE